MTPSPPDWLREVPFAHRGLHGDGIAENSLAAFAAAARYGYGVELDVRLSRDEVPVVVHDPSLGRLAGVAGRVTGMTAAQLAAVRLQDTDEGVPTLEDALAVLGDVPVMVEVKQYRPRPGRLEERVAAVRDGHRGPWCVASFNPATLRWFRRWRPAAIRVLAATSLPDPRLPRPLALRLASLRDLDRVAPHAVSYDVAGLPNEATDRWRADGGLLVAWTAIGPEGLARARTLADNVVFEHVLPDPPPCRREPRGR